MLAFPSATIAHTNVNRAAVPIDDNGSMPITNPWLTEPKPDGGCPRDLLEDRILNLLSNNNMAVIATVAKTGAPSATPVRYSCLGFEIMFTTWSTSPKATNLRRDPRVSAGIFAPLVGQASSRGAQLFGTATTYERDDVRAEPYWEAFRWQADHVECGRSLHEPPTDPLTVITPHRILYAEHWLRRQGYHPRQVWRPTDEQP